MFGLFKKKQKVSSRDLASDLFEGFDTVYKSCITMKPDAVRLTDNDYRRQSLAFVYSIGNLTIQQSPFDSWTKHALSVRFIEEIVARNNLFDSEVEAVKFLQNSWTELLPTLDISNKGVFPGFLMHFFNRTGVDTDDSSNIAAMAGISTSAMDAMTAAHKFLHGIAPTTTVTV
jgi:hypothetical protein